MNQMFNHDREHAFCFVYVFLYCSAFLSSLTLHHRLTPHMQTSLHFSISSFLMIKILTQVVSRFNWFVSDVGRKFVLCWSDEIHLKRYSLSFPTQYSRQANMGTTRDYSTGDLVMVYESVRIKNSTRNSQSLRDFSTLRTHAKRSFRALISRFFLISSLFRVFCEDLTEF